MHTCYCHKQLQNPRVSSCLAPRGVGRVLCCVVIGRTWLARGGPGWPPEPVGGRNFLFL